MKVAVVGATGLVGRKMLQVLAERQFPVDELIPVASAASRGREVSFGGQSWKVRTVDEAVAAAPDVALFSAGGSVSREWAPQFTDRGSYVIDNSSAWRMEPGIPLVVPEVNMDVVTPGDKLIANPNCSTIQMVVALAPLHARWGLRRIVVSTYQSITGTGKHAVAQYEAELTGGPVERVYPHAIFQNCLPHCDVFLDNGYTREEMKLVHETRKILAAPDLGITATAVRVPVLGGHSEAVNAQFAHAFTLDEVAQVLRSAPGVTLDDDPQHHRYPMPLDAHDRDEVFVGRLRVDPSAEHTLNLWIVADNLRKGAATNAVQIAESLLARGYLQAGKGGLRPASA
ncbi:MAG: aspartate-semialdehyde dehydrogenase [Saprospiraceae bacterium]|nr:aspartate-semialdehyde dehydrogenase [Saprospiraceae bacterium]